MKIHGKLVDIHNKTIFPATVTVENGRIVDVRRNSHRGNYFILPGFIDAHIHIESTLLPPSEFARMAVRHGTVATVSDPHEIANVLGHQGIEFMLENATKVPFKFYFGAPSCVPSTKYETAGATLGPNEVRKLLIKPTIHYLAEVMNYPGVINDDPDILAKIAIGKELGKRIDGHAPGVYGEDLKKYISAGIETDHECTTLSEAREKHALGMKILIRESSVAKNFNTLFPLLREDPENCMLCTDNLHPNHLQLGHINLLVKRAIERGMDPIEAIQAATKTPTDHYDLDVGLLREGDPADFIIVENLENLRVLETYIDGAPVFKNESLIPRIEIKPLNHFNCSPKKASDFAIPAQEGDVHVIVAKEGELTTENALLAPKIQNNQVVSDPSFDLLKIANVCRYRDQKPALGLIQNFGLKKGAIASSFSHSSHNIIAVGTADQDLADAVNAIIDAKGGLAISHQGKTDLLPLPIAGLMSLFEGEEVAVRYSNLEMAAKALGCNLNSPFMTLSFMALLTVPELKLSDQGLFDGRVFRLISLFE